MRDGDSDFLDKLAKSIADGDSIDWGELEKLAADDDFRELLRQLRLVADVADIHRSPFEDPPAEEISTRPEADSSAHRDGERLPPTAEPGQHDPIGGFARWGHLLLRRKIGEGAFGEVYHAHDTWLDHPVALKLVKPEIAQSEFSTHILHEARKLARVRHPNVVIVHGADRNDGRTGFWMDLVVGQTLADVVVQGRLNAGEAVYIGQEVCRALAAVHHANMIHRDVKAQNVMRASDGGRIILMDFGAGEFIDNPSAGARVQGTPLYLAPEILEHATPTVQTDIYAVGVLLFYLVTGGFPVVASSLAELIEKHRRRDYRRLRDSRPDLPDSFVAIVERALRAEPAGRYQSAGEMLTALGGDAAPVPVPQPVAWPKRAAVAMAAAVVVVEVLGLVASRAFEVALWIDPDFVASPVQYLWIGATALLPFLVYWLVGAALLGVLAGLPLTFRSLIHSYWRRWAVRLPSFDSATLATGIFLMGVAGLVAITWSFYSLFNAMNALRVGPIAAAVDLSVLSSAARSIHRAHGGYSAGLSFLLVLAVWRWFPRMEKHVDDVSRLRFLRWATVAVAFLVVAGAVIPRRIIWEQFEVASFENQRAFVIGSSSDELLLYAPRKGEPKRWRVRKNAANLVRSGKPAWIFDLQ